MSDTGPTTPPDTQIVELAAPSGDLVAGFAANAGMVGCSLRHRGEELLGLGDGLDAYLTTGKVFGIPLLHPWANRLGGWDYTAAGRRVVLDRGSPLLHGDEHCLPIHGTVASVGEWALTGRGDDEDGAWLTAELDVGAHPELLALFPFPHRIELAVRLGDASLRVTTTVRAGDAPVPLAHGFHPYLALRAPRARTGSSSCPRAASCRSTSAACPPASAGRGPPSASRWASAPTTTCSRWPAPRPLRGQRRRPAPAGRAGRRVPLRAGLRPARRAGHLLRADERPDRRAAQRRRAAARSRGRDGTRHLVAHRAGHGAVTRAGRARLDRGHPLSRSTA